MRYGWEIFTANRDFAHYRNILKVDLLSTAR